MDLPGWYVVLEAARKLSPDSRCSFTAPMLARALRIRGGDGVKIASKWLHKFTRWGYLQVVGTERGSGNRPRNVCIVTEKGHKCRVRLGRGAQLDQILHAIAALKKVKGSRGERSAMDHLFKVADEIQSS